MYGNTPDRWSDSLRGDDRLRCIVNGFTRLRYLHTDGRMDFKCTEAPADAPEGLIPWFQAPNRCSAGRPIIFGHWSSLGLRLQPDLIALDIGCVWGGSLTAIRLENRHVFQQPCPGAQTRREGLRQATKRLQCTVWRIPADWKSGQELQTPEGYIVDNRSAYPNESGMLYWQVTN